MIPADLRDDYDPPERGDLPDDPLPRDVLDPWEYADYLRNRPRPRRPRADLTREDDWL